MRTGLKALEIAINQYCKLDPETVARVAELSGKIIVVEITDWRVSWIILPHEKGVELSEDFTILPTVTLRGKLLDMIKVGLARGSNKALFENKIEMIGDSETGEKIREILRRIDIDWEEHLSKIVGDVAAHQLARSVHKIKTIGKKFFSELRQNVSEYFQVEASLLPTSDQTERFFSEVGRLRDDVDRLEARIHRLEQRKYQ